MDPYEPPIPLPDLPAVSIGDWMSTWGVPADPGVLDDLLVSLLTEDE